MVLAYRNWAGIGVNEDCMSALGWYELAAERGMLLPLPFSIYFNNVPLLSRLKSNVPFPLRSTRRPHTPSNAHPSLRSRRRSLWSWKFGRFDGIER
jgi:hypothetical protein